MCIFFKIPDRLIYALIDPMIKPLLPHGQAGSLHGKSAADHVPLKIPDIGDIFETKEKFGSEVLNLTALSAYQATLIN